MTSSRRCDVLVFEHATSFSGPLDSIKLHGSLVSAMATMYPGDLAAYASDLKAGLVRVSSPLAIDQGKLLVPVPRVPIKTADRSLDSILKAKAAKHVPFVPIELGVRMARAGAIDDGMVTEMLAAKGKLLGSTGDAPAVNIDRMTGASKIYYKTRATFKDGRLAVLIDAGTWRSKVMACLRFLGDTGISKRKSSGTGRFTVRASGDMTLAPGDKQLLLSSYVPAKDEVANIDFASSGFDVKVITGLTAAGRDLGIIRAVREGSVLACKHDLSGTVVDVYPDHVVAGIALCA